MGTDILSFIFSGKSEAPVVTGVSPGCAKSAADTAATTEEGEHWGKSEAPVVTGVSPGCPKSAADTAATTEEGEHGGRAKRL